MDTTNREVIKQYAKIIMKAWENEDFKKQLLGDAKKVLAQEGMKLPDDVEVKIAEGSNEQKFDVESRKLTLPLPPKPTDGVDPGMVANGDSCCCCCCPCCSC